MEDSDEERSVTFFSCPYLGGLAELNDERERHIEAEHDDLLPKRREYIAPTLDNPDRVQISPGDPEARIFSRWYPELAKYVIVVVIIHPGPRNWIITAYIAQRPARGETEWQRN